MNTSSNEDSQKRPYRDIANCRLMAISMVLLGGWLVVYVSVFTQLDVSKDQAQWFSRSGAVLTVSSLFATIWLAGLRSALVGDGGYGSIYGIEVYKEFKAQQTGAYWASHISAVAGTVIWGYGDLFYSWLTR